MDSLSLLPVYREQTGPAAGCVVVRLDQPLKPVVVLDLELIQRLEATLRSVMMGGVGGSGEAGGVSGLVLASASERVFVAGADLKAISELDDPALHRYLEYGAKVFGMLHEMPFPTVAAINGAALGGGLELAMHCDAIVGGPPAMKDGAPGRPYPIGLPEAGLAICPGWGGTNLLPARIDPADAIWRTASGATMLFDDAVKAGFFDRVADSADGLIATALAVLVEMRAVPLKRDGMPRRWIGRPACVVGVLKRFDSVRAELPNTEAAAAVARAVDAGLTRGWAAALEFERQELVRLRHTGPAKAALEAFFAKGKK